ncbi:hypothetical protein [Saliniramus fredricksonii]|uniref:hypothetical protein n=1 Tax=Saliniramus fredricksonii TaxID=1653334 RepID=UPI0010425835|nr:hypothetical protein [Saliniramus fredricksonii]
MRHLSKMILLSPGFLLKSPRFTLRRCARGQEGRARSRYFGPIAKGTVLTRETYFWETVAAIEMAVAMPLDTGQSIETALGPLKPDVDGECRPHSFCLLRVGGEVDDE